MDDSDVFWMKDAGPDSTTNDKSTLSRCALPDCAAPAVIPRDVSLYYPKGLRNQFTRALALNTSFAFWFDKRAYGWLDQVQVAAR
jgi:hypothetical protein